MRECQPSKVIGKIMEKEPLLWGTIDEEVSQDQEYLVQCQQNSPAHRGDSSGLPHMVLQIVPLGETQPCPASQARCPHRCVSAQSSLLSPSHTQGDTGSPGPAAFSGASGQLGGRT